MASVIFSPIISQIRGKTAEVVFSAWKGIAYIRRRVTPANPRTVAQTAQRDIMRRWVSRWHDLEEQIKDECKRLIKGLPLSGFNAFIGRNVEDSAKAVDERIMPLNAEVNAIATFEALTGSLDPGDIEVSWTLGEAAANDKIYFLAAEVVNSTPSDNLFLQESDLTDVSALGQVLTMPEPDTQYDIFALVEHVEDNTFSIARKATATANAAV